MNSGGTFSLSPQAENDLLQIAAYVGRSQKAKTVEFLRAARTTIDFLADSPFAGSPQPFEEERHHCSVVFAFRASKTTSSGIARSCRTTE